MMPLCCHICMQSNEPGSYKQVGQFLIGDQTSAKTDCLAHGEILLCLKVSF